MFTLIYLNIIIVKFEQIIIWGSMYLNTNINLNNHTHSCAHIHIPK